MILIYKIQCCYCFSYRSRCNTFKDAYEGISYPIDITKDTPLRIYHKSLCRMIDLEYQGTRWMDYGPEAFVYKIKKESYSNTTDTECVCHLPKCIDGVSNVAPCFYGKIFLWRFKLGTTFNL